jgi:R5 protein
MTLRKKTFGLRKYKSYGLVGVTLSSLAINLISAKAGIVSDGQDSPTVVRNISKVSSSSATRFEADGKSKTVDAVIPKSVAAPTKANSNSGDADGNDEVTFESSATVKYLLDSDKSQLKDPVSIDGESGKVKTPYDKKGLAFNTDGKDYRESSIEKSGNVLTKDTGKEDTLEANGKNYRLVRSEIIGADKKAYTTTSFNNIDAPVSPEGMHNSLGEINYNKSSGKIYIVEETEDGHYGNFVVADSVTDDESVISAWHSKQDSVKPFTKENVALNENDTIIVIDKDTYATLSASSVNKVKRGRGTATYQTTQASPQETISNLNGGTPTFAFGSDFPSTLDNNSDDVIFAGDDDIFGTSDDFVGKYTKPENKHRAYIALVTDSFAHPNNLEEVIHDAAASIYSMIDSLVSSAQEYNVNEEFNKVRNDIKQREARIVKYIKDHNFKLMRFKNDSNVYLMFPELDEDDTSYEDMFEDLRTQLKELTDPLAEMKITKELVPEFEEKLTKEAYTFKKTVKSLRLTVDSANHSTDISLDEITKKWNVSIPSDILEYDIVWNEPVEESTELADDYQPSADELSSVTDQFISDTQFVRTFKKLSSSDKSTIYKLPDSEDAVHTLAQDFTETTSAKKQTYDMHEIITPIRAYKVMANGDAEVIHYYELGEVEETTPSKVVEKRGSVTVKYVDSTGKEIRPSKVIYNDELVSTVSTYRTMSGNDVIRTRDDEVFTHTKYDTSPNRTETLTNEDGSVYKYRRLYSSSDGSVTSAPESGEIPEGMTTVIYEYYLKKPDLPTTGDITAVLPIFGTVGLFTTAGILETLKRKKE